MEKEYCEAKLSEVDQNHVSKWSS